MSRAPKYRKIASLVLVGACELALASASLAQTLTVPRGSFTISDSARRHVDSVFTKKYQGTGCVRRCTGDKARDRADFVKHGGDPNTFDATYRPESTPTGCVEACTGDRWQDSLNFESQLLRDSLDVSVVATGNLRTGLTNGGGSTPAAGALGISIGEFERNLTVLVNVAGLTDTLSRNAGSALLPPGAGGLTSGQVSALVDYRSMVGYHGWGYHGFGYHFYGSVAPAVFKDTVTKNAGTANAVIAAVGAQLSWEVYNQAMGSTAILFLLDAGPTYRGIAGDAAGGAFKAQRGDLFNTASTNFLGAETGMTLFVKDVRVGVSTYYMFGGHVPGLSGLQAVFGVSVSDAFLSARSSRQHNLGLEGSGSVSAPPNVPKLDSLHLDNGAVTIAWDTVQSALYYAILRSDSLGKEKYPPIGTTTSHSFTDYTVKPGNKYYYVVESCSATACSTKSSELSEDIPPETAKPAAAPNAAADPAAPLTSTTPQANPHDNAGSTSSGAATETPTTPKGKPAPQKNHTVPSGATTPKNSAGAAQPPKSLSCARLRDRPTLIAG